MRTLTKELVMNVPRRRAVVSIHDDVERLVGESGVRDGLVLINAIHITASVFINDNEPGLHRDYESWLEQLAPFDASPQRYFHNQTGEDNADADEANQKAHFGRVVLENKELATYCIWYRGLTPEEASEWDEFVSRLQPGDALVERLGKFRFSGEPPAMEGVDEEKDLASIPRELILQAVSRFDR